MMAKRTKHGDVLEIVTSKGWIYVHYLGRHPTYGDAIAVCPTKHAERALVRPELFHGSYVIFYPATASVNRGLSSVVGHLPSPGLPTRLRRAGVRSGRKVATWIIEDGSRETLKERLSDEDRKLPIAAIWNHEFLVERISEGWRPEMEGRDDDDRPALEELRQASNSGAARVVSHYLYFPEEGAAVKAAAELRSLGFKTEERLGAEGTNWLVLVRHEAIQSEEAFMTTRAIMEGIARARDGEYDGWETELQQ